VTVSPVRDQNGRIIGASKIAHDISDRKAAEEAIRQSMAIKDQFLGLVSHELRTPIASIYGNGLLLQRRGEHLAPEDREQSLADIVSESKKLQSIIENLLMLTRLEAGQLDQAEPLSLAPIIETEIAELQRSHPERKVMFSPGLDVPPASGQQTLISLVVRNLLGNAEKYSPPETTIQVSLRCNEAGLPEISIRDNGIGMEPDDLAEIFTPFYRSQRARITAKGMGVGLAVCRRIIEAHGGTITVNSRPDQGSEFVFTLRPAEPEGPA
jgi:signal transduction histidine kinase